MGKRPCASSLSFYMKLIIGSCFYEVKAYAPYITSLVDSIKALNDKGVDFEYFEHSGDSYVDRAKNTLAHRFMESDATHLFMIDSDLMWNTEGFMRVVEASKRGLDVVGGAYPNKNNWATYGAVPVLRDGSYVGHEREGLRVLEMKCIPGGFLIYTRKAFEMAQPLIKKYHNASEGLNGMSNYEYFRCDISEKGWRIGEDVYFQRKYREAGGKIFLEPDITFTHWGVKGWMGNYHQYLLNKGEKKESV